MPRVRLLGREAAAEPAGAPGVSLGLQEELSERALRVSSPWGSGEWQGPSPTSCALAAALASPAGGAGSAPRKRRPESEAKGAYNK